MDGLQPKFSALGLLAEDQNVLLYRPKLRPLAGSPTAAILLAQCVYYAKLAGWGPFYKFRKPCKHALYRPGDSWTETLGFSSTEFDTALRKIGSKLKQGESKLEALQQTTANGLVIYWTTASRVTYYLVNTPLLEAFLDAVYAASGKAKSEILIYLSKSKNPDYKVIEETLLTKVGKPDLPINIDTQIDAEIEQGAAAPPPPKPKGKKGKPKKETTPAEIFDPMVAAFAEVCIMDLAANRGQISREAKTLIGAGYEAAETIRSLFGKGGAWYEHTYWGQKGSPPQPQQIRQNVAFLLSKQNGSKPAGPDEPPPGLPGNLLANWANLSPALKANIANNGHQHPAVKAAIEAELGTAHTSLAV